MSREIKFRAWDKLQSKMHLISGISFTNKDVWLKINDKQIMGANFSEIEIMQYSGIKDVTGKEVYEGDIVEFYNDEYYVLHPGVAKVIFDLGAFQLENEKYGADYLGNMDIDDMDIRVIGNIYDNPELLEKLESEVEQ